MTAPIKEFRWTKEHKKQRDEVVRLAAMLMEEELIYAHLDIPDYYRRHFAVYVLKGRAKHWIENYKAYLDSAKKNSNYFMMFLPLMNRDLVKKEIQKEVEQKAAALDLNIKVSDKNK